MQHTMIEDQAWKPVLLDDNIRYNLFVYGILTNAKTLRAVLKHNNFEFEPKATLTNYAIVALSPTIPELKKAQFSLGAHIVGCLISGLRMSDIKRLDFFEGEGLFYKRKEVEVIRANGQKCVAFIYVDNDPWGRVKQ